MAHSNHSLALGGLASRDSISYYIYYLIAINKSSFDATDGWYFRAVRSCEHPPIRRPIPWPILKLAPPILSDADRIGDIFIFSAEIGPAASAFPDESYACANEI